MNKGSSLSPGAVDSEGNVESSLHEKTVQDRSVVTIVVETVDQTLIANSLSRVGSPNDSLVQVCDSHSVVFIIELKHESVETLGQVVDRAGVGRMKNLCRTTSRESDVEISLGDFPSGGSVSIDSLGN